MADTTGSLLAHSGRREPALLLSPRGQVTAGTAVLLSSSALACVWILNIVFSAVGLYMVDVSGAYYFDAYAVALWTATGIAWVAGLCYGIGLVCSGLVGLRDDPFDISVRPALPAEAYREREALVVLQREGKCAAVDVALRTTLTVAEAEEILSGLAAGGHLQVRVEGTRLLYGLH